MKNSIKQLIKTILSFLSLTAISCEKWIETDFPTNQLPTELVFENEQTADATLAGLYANLWNNSLISGGQDGMGLLMGLYTDDIATVIPAGSNGIVDLYYNQQIPTNLMVLTVWTNAYQHIYAANSILEGVGNSKSLSQVVKDRITGEALFIRSLLYLYLHQIYGDIPFADTTDYKVNSKLSKLSGNDILNRLEKDLSEAVGLLPSAYRSTERIYSNKSAGYILLAKVKMLLGKWTQAEVLLGAVMQSSDYSFQHDITKVFQKNGSHIIWQLKPKNEGDATKEASLYNFSGIPTTYMLSTDLVNSFADSDLRKQAYLSKETAQGQVNYKSVKYKNLQGSNTTEYSVIYRLEEVYLMYAETLIHQNRVVEAIPYLNKTRVRAGLDPLAQTINQPIAMNELMEEKRREFFIEHGIRFFDLKRWGMLGELMTVKPNWKAHYERWPLPQQEMLLNSNLNPQNQGY
ncbi:RagB/SusD domain-containing protein [Chryseobacterium rhizoplanae]|uniref:RagB/SusD domain-containing protein n=1 Tax=Chryseobacterium rhizoplanae TaxID=1609531 RepID=A0A521DKS5_9FLAO|nr:RagB/SusD family nutrient uptake outer membrane protein [Chryseobacterium rhizoplanae]SMO72296.1 RagB/SusD domain-containing protein [Chryseobacterium rhizoplanae]